MKRFAIASALCVFLGALAFGLIRRAGNGDPASRGTITIRLSPRSVAASVEISWETTTEKPGAFPAVVTVPLGKVIDINATHPKFSPYRQELVLYEDRPETVVTVALEEVAVRFTAGFRDSELPSTAQVRFHAELGAVRDDAPDAIFERVGSGCLSVDREANVWRCRPAQPVTRWERVTKWEYWQVGRVDRVHLERMKALVEAATRTESSAEDRCSDCDGYVIKAHRPPPRIDALELARDGPRRGVRQNPEARILARWILALCRDAPAYDPSRVDAGTRPDG